MKNIITILLVLISVTCLAQQPKTRVLTDTSRKIRTITDTTSRLVFFTTTGASGKSVTFFDYDATLKADTSKCVLLITECVGCTSKSVNALVISERWTPLKYIDENKKPFNKEVIIWQYKF